MAEVMSVNFNIANFAAGCTRHYGGSNQGGSNQGHPKRGNQTRYRSRWVRSVQSVESGGILNLVLMLWLELEI